jgi:hypothetical protein
MRLVGRKKLIGVTFSCGGWVKRNSVAHAIYRVLSVYFPLLSRKWWPTDAQRGVKREAGEKSSVCLCFEFFKKLADG